MGSIRCSGKPKKSCKIPTGEIGWAQYSDADGNLQYLVTSRADRKFYYLYAVEGDGYKKIGKASNPAALNKFFPSKNT